MPTGDLRSYNVDDYTAQSVGLPFDPPADESLSDAICCDATYAGFAEPRGLYAQPDVALFRKVDKGNVTVFYDSVCGLPLFQAPVGRTFEEWEVSEKRSAPPFSHTHRFFSVLFNWLSQPTHSLIPPFCAAFFCAGRDPGARLAVLSSCRGDCAQRLDPRRRRDRGVRMRDKTRNKRG